MTIKKHPGPYAPEPWHWKQCGGLWYVSPTPPISRGDPWEMFRWRPNVDSLCEPLLGMTVFDYTDKKNTKVAGVRYPTLKEQHRLYREALQLLIVFGDRRDLFAIACYRRQIEQANIGLDDLFFELACSHSLSFKEWRDLAQRMPHGSKIQLACRAKGQPLVLVYENIPPPLAKAA